MGARTLSRRSLLAPAERAPRRVPASSGRSCPSWPGRCSSRTTAVRTRLELLVGGLLRQLFAQGAFAGATPAESYFVRTASDAALPGGEADAGQLVCQIGLAPAEPLEFIIVSISRDAEGALSAETFGG